MTNTTLTNYEQLAELNNTRVLGNLIIDGQFVINSPYDLTLIAEKNIIFKAEATIILKNSGSLYLKSGIEDLSGTGTVIFENTEQIQIISENGGKVIIHYNPIPDPEEIKFTHKYHNPEPHAGHVWPFTNVDSYMLVNNVEDLQNIMSFLHANYALSCNINASETESWSGGRGFKPLTYKNLPFSGNFDGNGFTISNIYINRSDEKFVGLFGLAKGYESLHTHIENLSLKNFKITGRTYVGALAGGLIYNNIKNVHILNSNVTGEEIIGGIAGTVGSASFNNIYIKEDTILLLTECGGVFFGAIRDSIIHDSKDFCENLESNDGLNCSGYSVNVDWE